MEDANLATMNSKTPAAIGPTRNMVSVLRAAMDTNDMMKSARALEVAARSVTDDTTTIITTMNGLDRTRIR
jgi:hypothetical protein